MRYVIAGILIAAALTGVAVMFFAEDEADSLGGGGAVSEAPSPESGSLPSRRVIHVSLTAHVTDREGRGVSHGEVLLSWRRDLEPERGRGGLPKELRGEIAADGRVRLSLPPRALEGVLTVRAEGFAPKQVAVLSTGRRNVDLGTVILGEGGEIQGVVLDEEGNPLPDARITAAPRGVQTGRGQSALFRRGLDAGQAREALSDANGEFLIHGLPYGRLALRADKKGFLSVGIGEVLLESSAATAFVELTMKRGKTLRLQVISDSTGQPVPGAEIELFAANWRPEDSVLDELIHRKGKTDTDGTLLLKDLARRPYLVKMKAPGYFTPTDPTIDAGAEEFVIRIHPAGRLLVSVRGDGGRLLQNPQVSVVNPRTADRMPVRILKRNEAWEQERVQVGEGVLLVAGLTQPRVTLVVKAKGHATRIVDVAGIQSGVLRPVDVELPREVPLSGRVVTFDGHPVGGAQIIVQRKGQEERGRGVELALLRGDLSAMDPLNGKAPARAPDRIRATADDQGRFVVQGLGAGEFDLKADHPEHRSGETSCVLQEGVPLKGLEIRLPVEGGILGRVSWGGGRPAAGASVIVTKGGEIPSGGMGLLFAMESAVARCWSEPDGTFRFSALPPGAYRVSAVFPVSGRDTNEWLRTQGQVVQVPAGRSAEVELVLARKP
ncbi:MAG TPA: hypothetical protein ENK43_04650 [Planctomycetes bacterium]|nr:hypothetical protein [Planctomycetota bacterium]